MATDYQLLVNDVFFNDDISDNVFKNSVKPHIKDKDRFERAGKVLGDPTNKTIFEVGPFPGTGIYYFGENNKIVGYGKTDLAFSEKVERVGHALVECDLESDIPIDSQAEIVLFMEVLEHIRNPLKALKNLSKMVKPGGLLYLTTNNQFYIGYIFKLLLNRNIYDPVTTQDTFYPGHCRYYDISELQLFFNELGWKIVQSNNVNFLPSRKLYKNEYFGFWKNTIVNLVPKRYSTHIELLLKKND